MGHHLESPSAYRVNDLGSLFQVSNFEFLLKENGRLLVRRFDNTCNEDMIRRG
jgi:hypothetical protein